MQLKIKGGRKKGEKEIKSRKKQLELKI